MRIAVVGAELEENLAVRYIRAALVADGHHVFQVDFNRAEDTQAAARAIVAGKPDLVALSMVFTARAREFVGLAQELRSLGYSGHIIAGGHFAALNAEALLADVAAIDSIGLGEGETIVCDLAKSVREPATVPSLVWRAADGTVVRNPAASTPTDLTRLPWPVRRCPPDRYLGLPIVNLLSSRGCSYGCAFCSIAAWHSFCGGPRHRVRDVNDVADEMATLYADGVRIFNFHDDNFLPRGRDAAMARVRALGDALAARQVGRIAFAIKARPDEVDAELFESLRSLGLFRVFLGIEAGTATSLRTLGRGQTLDQNEHALDVVNRLGLHACFNLLLLNPDSTLDDLAANVAFLRRRPDNPMNFCRTEIYAGTPLERKLRRQGRLLGDYFGYDYRIVDARAEAACQLLYDVFGPRNYGDCLHHKVMAIDYENTLLGHFHARPDARTTAQVKGFIRRVNLDTCDYLDSVVAWAAGRDPRGSYSETAAELRRRMRASEARLMREGDRLLRQVRARAAGPGWMAGAKRTPLPSRSRAVAAAAGLAASLAVAGYARGDLAPIPAPPAKAKAPARPPSTTTRPTPDWHMVEMAPARPVRPPTPAPPVPAAPAPDAAKAKEAELRNQVTREVLRKAVRGLRQATALQLQVTLDPKGRVARVVVEQPEQAAKKIEAAVRRLSFKSDGRLAGQPIDLAYTVDEVQTQLELLKKKPTFPPPSHPCERAPAREWSGSHSQEEIP